MVERFGRYVLLERIAHGGMAEVFRAASVGTDGFSKLLAVKRILPHLAAEKAFVTMLIDEAKIAATLNHPNVLQVLDLGRENGVYFIAMEFVAGQALNNVVAQAIRAQQRLSPGFCFHVVAQALQGLSYAHNKTDALGKPLGIIHRDVSPQNIMVAYDGAVRLADFGIAKAAERSTQTLTGSLKGKPAYMSPEQVQGKPIDQRMDIYAMGVVLHELLAMKRMRKASTDVQILLDVAKGEFPRFEQLGIEIPEEAAAVVYKALEPEPNDRWQTAEEFARALEDTARKLGWHFGAAQVSQVMQKLFPAELEKERTAQNTFQQFVQELSSADNDEVSNLIKQHAPALEEISGLKTMVTPAPPGGGGGQVNNFMPTLVTPSSGVKSVGGVSRTGVKRPHPEDEAPPSSSGVGKVIGALIAVLVLAGGGLFAWMQMKPATGTLIVETVPAGATITIGGKKQAGVAPIVSEQLPAGPIEISAELDGMVPTKDVVTVEAGGSRRVRLSLSAREVPLPVKSDPPGAAILVDGKAVGETPMTLTLTGGRVTVRLELHGYMPVQQQVDPAKAPSELSLTLVKRDEKQPEAGGLPDGDGDRPRDRKKRDDDEGSAGGGSGKGLITLRSDPWARIIIDGKDTGMFTPKAEIPIAAGKHTIKLLNDEENLSATFTVVVKPGQSLNLSKELH